MYIVDKFELDMLTEGALFRLEVTPIQKDGAMLAIERASQLASGIKNPQVCVALKAEFGIDMPVCFAPVRAGIGTQILVAEPQRPFDPATPLRFWFIEVVWS